MRPNISDHPFTVPNMKTADTPTECFWGMDNPALAKLASPHPPCGHARHSKRHAGWAIEYLPSPRDVEEADFGVPKQAEEKFVRLKDVPVDNRAVVAYHEVSAGVLAILRDRAGYRDAWIRQGYMGNFSRILSKAARLEGLAWKDWEDGGDSNMDSVEKSVLDDLHDIMALCAFAITNIEEGNRWGRGQ